MNYLQDEQLLRCVILAMSPQERLRFLLREAKSKDEAQRIAREFLMQQKALEAKKKKEVNPSAHADMMMKRLREAHQLVSGVSILF